MTAHTRWVAAAGLGAGLLAGSSSALRRPALQRHDVRIGDAVRRAGSPALDRVVTVTTDLGSMYAVAGMAAALAASGRQDLAADVLAVGTAAWAVAQASKNGVRRERPYEADGVRRLVRPPAGSSFPSGHAAVGMAVMTVVAERAQPRAAAPLLRGVGAYVAVSRVYVGVHYPTDVLGGAGLGLLLGSVWRGPLAAAGRALATGSLATARRVVPPLLRLTAWAAVGVRPRSRHGRRGGRRRSQGAPPRARAAA